MEQLIEAWEERTRRDLLRRTFREPQKIDLMKSQKHRYVMFKVIEVFHDVKRWRLPLLVILQGQISVQFRGTPDINQVIQSRVKYMSVWYDEDI